MSEREEIIGLIRDEYDPAPSHYKRGDDWDDGAGRIADAILADKTLALRHAADRIETLEAALQSTGDLHRRLDGRIETLEATLRWIADFEPEYAYHGTLNVQVVRILETARAALAEGQDK